MRTAVTGASGYLGRSYMKMYSGTRDFIALSRSEGASDHADGTEYRSTDYSVESLKEIFRGCDSVVHLAYAMAVKENEQRGLEAYRSSMEATENVLKAAHELGISNIVFASSRMVYPAHSPEPFREDGETAPGSAYGKSKVMMEELCMDYNKRGAAVKVLRFGQIIGAGMKVRGLFQVFVENAMNNEPLTMYGSDVRDYLYIKDACGAIEAALSHPEAAGIYNISMGTGTDNRLMARAAIEAAGSSSEILTKETGSNYVPSRIVLDCSKADRELGFRCRYATIYDVISDAVSEWNA